MEKNLKRIENKLERLKVQLRDIPKEMKRNFAWNLMKETLRNDFEGTMWLYDEMHKFVDENFRR